MWFRELLGSRVGVGRRPMDLVGYDGSVYCFSDRYVVVGGGVGGGYLIKRGGFYDGFVSREIGLTGELLDELGLYDGYLFAVMCGLGSVFASRMKLPTIWLNLVGGRDSGKTLVQRAIAGGYGNPDILVFDEMPDLGDLGWYRDYPLCLDFRARNFSKVKHRGVVVVSSTEPLELPGKTVVFRLERGNIDLSRLAFLVSECYGYIDIVCQNITHKRIMNARQRASEWLKQYSNEWLVWLATCAYEVILILQLNGYLKNIEKRKLFPRILEAN